jgi:hypothetical protein
MISAKRHKKIILNRRPPPLMGGNRAILSDSWNHRSLVPGRIACWAASPLHEAATFLVQHVVSCPGSNPQTSDYYMALPLLRLDRRSYSCLTWLCDTNNSCQFFPLHVGSMGAGQKGAGRRATCNKRE